MSDLGSEGKEVGMIKSDTNERALGERYFDNESLRKEKVEASRRESGGDFVHFFLSRLQSQWGIEPKERDDKKWGYTSADAAINNYIDLRGEESNYWTNEEKKKIHKTAAAFVALNIDDLTQRDKDYWLGRVRGEKRTRSRVADFFYGNSKVTLEPDEMEALDLWMQRIGKQINLKENVIKRPPDFFNQT